VFSQRIFRRKKCSRDKLSPMFSRDKQILEKGKLLLKLIKKREG